MVILIEHFLDSSVGAAHQCVQPPHLPIYTCAACRMHSRSGYESSHVAEGLSGVVTISKSIWRPSAAPLAGFDVGKVRTLEVPGRAPSICATFPCQPRRAPFFCHAGVSGRRSADPHGSHRSFTGTRSLKASEGGPQVVGQTPRHPVRCSRPDTTHLFAHFDGASARRRTVCATSFASGHGTGGCRHLELAHDDVRRMRVGGRSEERGRAARANGCAV